MTDMILAVQSLWRWPLMLYIYWLEVGAETLSPPHPPPRPGEHGQLAVPEAIEDAGERALFA